MGARASGEREKDTERGQHRTEWPARRKSYHNNRNTRFVVTPHFFYLRSWRRRRKSSLSRRQRWPSRRNLSVIWRTWVLNKIRFCVFVCVCCARLPNVCVRVRARVCMSAAHICHRPNVCVCSRACAARVCHSALSRTSSCASSIAPSSLVSPLVCRDCRQKRSLILRLWCLWRLWCLLLCGMISLRKQVSKRYKFCC